MMKRVLCAVFGCPPVVHSCWGQLTCARCGAIVGDTLTGSTELYGLAIVDCECCDDCGEVLASLSLIERLLTPLHRPTSEERLERAKRRESAAYAFRLLFAFMLGATLGVLAELIQ